MVTGFNTDVEHDGKVYHVQTEDKGLANPLIETLIYRGGEILAARRSTYTDLVEQGADEAAVAARIEAQHNQMILDVKAGRYDVKRHRPFGEGIISNKSFDEVVLDYLKSQGGSDRLVLDLVDGHGFQAGETVHLQLAVSRRQNGESVSGAKIRVKLLSSAGKPRVLTQGETGEDGRVTLDCSLPSGEGRAALVIQATSGAETVEIKRPIGGAARKAAG